MQASLDQKRFVTMESRVVDVKISTRLTERETPEFGLDGGSDPSNVFGLGMEPKPVGAPGAGGVGLAGGLMLLS